MAIILATMSFGPMLAANMMGMLNVDNGMAAQERQNVCTKLANAVSNYLTNKDSAGLQRVCRSMMVQVPDLKSIQIVRFDGINLYSSPDHHRYWTLSPDQPSTINAMRVPLNRDGKVWAELEVAFDPATISNYGPWIKWGVLIGLGFALNFGSFSLFLGRLMKGIDTKSAVPKRVRNTLDTIVGGVVILDTQGKILLANESFAACVGKSPEDLMTTALVELPWRSEQGDEWPWEFALREKAQKTAVKIHLRVEEGHELSFMVNATPVLDANDQLSGALVSFENISVMEDQRKELVRTLNALEASQEQIRRQNEVLHQLASRDGLTGAFNRRALYEKVEALWENRNEGDRGLISIMMDVDHFKKLNDQHGHAAGDAVLKDVVRVVQEVVGNRGIVARYGGEEFCVVMERATVEEGCALAEEVREGIQDRLANPYHVTASIGVSSSLFGAKTIQLQIEQADKGLYAAKHSGRNAVRCWSEQLEKDAEEAERKKAEKLSQVEIEEHPISYHAVVALNAALCRKDPELAAHCHRVAEMSVALGRGLVSVEYLYTLEIASLLHEVGVLGGNEDALDSCRNWKLDNATKSARDARNELGVDIVRSAIHSPELLDILNNQFHPYCGTVQKPMSGEAIPVGARILAVTSAYDKMTSNLNSKPLTHDEAIEELRRAAGIELDPTLVERFANAPMGWRPYGMVDSMVSDREAVMLGYQLERVLHCFHSRNLNLLKSRLLNLTQLSKQVDMPAMAILIEELLGEAERKAIADWDSLLPMIQDLMELCMIVQRAYWRNSSQHGRSLNNAAVNR